MSAVTDKPHIASKPPLVSIRNLTVKRGRQIVLNGLHCEIPNGRITALVGLNGCGKSTLLRAIVGECHHSGTIQFACGHDHSRPRPEHVGYVPQKLLPDGAYPLTVQELLGVALQPRPLIFGISKSRLISVAPLLNRLGIQDLLHVPIQGLSGGQLQRVLLALALEPKPELLLLDEPAAGIDFRDQQFFYNLIAEINQEYGVTVLLVSHDLQTVRRLAHHVLCLKNGVIVSQGQPTEVLIPEVVEATFFR